MNTEVASLGLRCGSDGRVFAWHSFALHIHKPGRGSCDPSIWEGGGRRITVSLRPIGSTQGVPLLPPHQHTQTVSANKPKEIVTLHFGLVTPKSEFFVSCNSVLVSETPRVNKEGTGTGEMAQGLKILLLLPRAQVWL